VFNRSSRAGCRVRHSLALLAALAALVAVGCGGDDDDSSSATPATTDAAKSEFPQLKMPEGANSATELQDKTIGLIIITQASEVFPLQQKAMKEAFGTLGWEMKLVDIAGDISKVPAAVDNLLQSGVDAIVLQSVEPGFVGKQAAARAKAKGVPIIGQSTGVPTEKSDGILSAAVETPQYPAGKAEGEQFVSEFGEGAKVALIIDKLAATGRDGQRGFTEGLAGRADVVAQHQIDYAKLVPDVTATVQQWLVQHPDLKAVWCPYDGACVGAGEAIQAAGKDVAVLSQNGTPTAFDLIRSGLPYTTWAQALDYVNWLTTDLLVATLAKRDVEPTTLLKSVKIDESNVPESGVLPGTALYGDFESKFKERWGVSGG
jgi:ribose transport system substrate-binding protein